MAIRRPYVIMLLAVIMLAVYYVSLFGVSNSVDDQEMITAYLNLEKYDIVGMFLPHGTGYYYRPLLGLTFMADRYLWFMHSGFLHLENVLLHVLNTLILFLIAERLFDRMGIASIWVPFCSALFFGLHPIATESVNWLSGRTDPLACLFILIATLFLITWCGNRKFIFLAVSSFALFLACLAKETSVFFLPGYLLIMFFYNGQKLDRSVFLAALKTSVLPVAAVAGYFVLRHYALSGDSGIHVAATGVANDINPLYWVKVFFKVTGFYVKKMIWPFPLNFAITTVSNAYILPGVLVLLLSFYLLVRRTLFSAFFLASYALLMSALIVVVSRMAWTPLAERYAYIATAFFAIPFIYFLFRHVSGGRTARFAVITGMLLLVWGSGTFARNLVWRDNLKLYKDTVSKSPDHPPSRNELAIALKERGRYEEARSIFMGNSVANDVRNKEFAESNKANILYSEGDIAGAHALLKKNLNKSSGTYGAILKKLVNINDGRFENAGSDSERKEIYGENVGYLTDLHRLTNNPFYFYRLGQTHLAIGNKRAARNFFERAFKESPETAHYRAAAQKLAGKLAAE